jgi:hypothetical protein
MDIYLPAEFHELRNAAPDDWRDVYATTASLEKLRMTENPSGASLADSKNSCADPLWRVF